MKIYKVWSEGYSVTGQHCTAFIIGEIKAPSFGDACELLHQKPEYKSLFSTATLPNGDTAYFSWGCRLFDNEQDARKNFG